MSLHIPRFLLVDDDPALLHCLCDLLTYRLRPAVVILRASSDHVVADVIEGHYDVVVCDLKMPHQDGLAVIRQVKAVNPGQRIILITGCIDESIEQEAQQQGADSVLRKPFDCDEVVRVIRSLVELSLTKREPGDVERLPAASV